MHKGPFTITKNVKANDTGIIYYHENVSINPKQIILIDRTFKPDAYNQLKLEYFIAGNNTEIEQLSAGGFKIEVKQGMDSFFFETLHLDANHHPVSFGLMMERDTAKYGNWQFWDSNGKESYKIYSKRLILTAQSFSNLGNEYITLFAKCYGKWIPLKSMPFYDHNLCYIPDGTDSLKVFNKNGKNAFKLNYKGLGNENYISIYLVKPGQFFVSLNGSQMPVELIPNVYRIEPDWVGLQKMNKEILVRSNLYRTSIKPIRDYQADPIRN